MGVLMARRKVGESNERYARVRGIVGRNLRTAREKNKLTQAEVARRMNRASSWVAEIELGRSNVYVLDMWALAEMYGVPVDGLYAEDGTPTSWRIPANLPEWERMFEGDERRASIHWNIEKIVMDARHPNDSPGVES